MKLEYRSPSLDEFANALRTTHSAFGEDLKDDDIERQRQLMPLDRVLAAWDSGRPVGVTASYPFELTIPGGEASAAGVTWVGVLSSHRRRGVLRELMRRQLDDVHERAPLQRRSWMRSEARSRSGTIPGRVGRCGS